LARGKRRSRKRKRSGQAPAPPPPRPSRSEAKDAAARAALEPLAEGERPAAVTVGAVVAAALAVANMAFYLSGFEISGDRPPITGVLVYTGLMVAAAWGMWKARYWAVLGMQALLGLLILVFSLSALFAENALAVVVSIVVVVPAGVLFWFLIKAMARIQMPVRR
jgi:hypothetical protein